MKKKLIIIISIILVVIAILIGLYFNGLKPVSKSNEIQLFKINSGAGKMDIINDLKKEGLIKSKISSYIYVIFNRDLNLQAGVYELSPNMGVKSILQKIHEGKIQEEKNQNTFSITFVEGKRFPYYANKIADATGKTKEEVIAELANPEYLKELINKYWFLTESILDDKIYYPLEGYLFPSTYEFYKNSSVKDIVKVMLDTFGSKLKTYEETINNSKYNIHEILTLASIVEVEGAGSDDRAGVAGVFYNRLKAGDSLGSDATTYYAAKVEFSERDLYNKETNDCNNGYNTRGTCNIGKLPVGPICCPSIEALISTINPEEHDYYFFVADKYKKTYFTKTNSEHESKVNELKAAGLWFTYNK